ncbi:MAG: hypothetical protein SNH01_09390 [Rikenellaceae bacterium]
MKKILTLAVAFAFAITAASAQEVVNYTFEDGTYNGWSVWQKKENVIVGEKFAKDSKHALKAVTGTFFDLKGVKEKTTYILTADTRGVQQGQEAGIVKVEYYDPTVKKLTILKETPINGSMEYKKITMKFKTKVGGYHRVTFCPSSAGYSQSIIDNVKIVKADK